MLKISKQNEVEIKALFKDGANIAKIKGAVHYLNESKERATDKEVITLLGTYGFVAPKRATNFRGNLYNLLVEGNLSESDFKDLLVNASDNTVNNTKHFNAIRELCNTVRANATAKANKGVK